MLKHYTCRSRARKKKQSSFGGSWTKWKLANKIWKKYKTTDTYDDGWWWQRCVCALVQCTHCLTELTEKRVGLPVFPRLNVCSCNYVRRHGVLFYYIYHVSRSRLKIGSAIWRCIHSIRRARLRQYEMCTFHGYKIMYIKTTNKRLRTRALSRIWFLEKGVACVWRAHTPWSRS